MPRSRFQLLIIRLSRMALPESWSDPSQVVVRARPRLDRVPLPWGLLPACAPSKVAVTVPSTVLVTPICICGRQGSSTNLQRRSQRRLAVIVFLRSFRVSSILKPQRHCAEPAFPDHHQEDEVATDGLPARGVVSEGSAAIMSKRTDEPDGPADMAMLTRAFQVSKMLQVAAVFELADRVADRPQSATRLAQECGANPDMLLRLCRALAAFDIFAVDDCGNVSQTRRSAWLRCDGHPTLHHAARYWTMPSNWAAWGNLEEAIRTGNSAFQITFDLAYFEHLKAHPDEAQLFDAFMQHSPDDRHAAVAEAYDFSGARLVVDVGGGNGALIAAILTANPDVHGLLFDQEMVVSGASQVL